MEYKGYRLTGFYKIDFVCFDSVVVEVKAVSSVGPAEDAQVPNCLALSGHPTSAAARCSKGGLCWIKRKKEISLRLFPAKRHQVPPQRLDPRSR